MRLTRLVLVLTALLVPGLAHAQLRQRALKLNSPTLSSQYGAAESKSTLQGNPSYTLEAWVYPDNYTNFPTIVSNSYAHSFWLGLNTSGKVRFYPLDAAHGYFEGATTVPTGRWTHVAVTYTSGDARLYVNGALDAQSSAFTGTAPSDTAALCVGADRGDAGTNFYWRGMLDEVRVWASARTQAQIQSTMTLPITVGSYFPSGAYATMRANWTFELSSVNSAADLAFELGDHDFLDYIHGDMSSLISPFGSPVAVNTAMTFDGTSDYQDTGMGDGFSAGLSIEAWILTTGSLGYQTIVGRNFLTSFWLGLTPEGHLRFYPTGGLGNFVDSDEALPLNAWVHVAATYRNGAIVLYHNGGPMTFRGAAVTGPIGENATTAWIGADHEGSPQYRFVGQMDEVRITRGRISPQSVAKQVMEGYGGFANPMSVLDQDIAVREVRHFSMDGLSSGWAGTGAALVRSGAPLLNPGPGEMSTIYGQQPYLFDHYDLATRAQSEAGYAGSEFVQLYVPYDAIATDPHVFVVATITDLANCTVTLYHPGGAQIPLLAPGQARGRDLLTIFSDGAPFTFASAQSPYLDGVKPATALSYFAASPTRGYWALGVTVPPPARLDVIAWGLHFSSTPTGVGDAAPARIALANRGANPSRQSAQLEFTLPAAAQVSLGIFDVGGRRIAEIYRGRAESGTTVLGWNTASVPPGTYFARLAVGGQTSAETRLTIIR